MTPPTDIQLLHAISIVESNDNPAAVGKAGERGRHQIHPLTFADYSKVPFADADEAELLRVAKSHLAWLGERLKANHIKVTPYFLAIAWSAGIGRAVTGKYQASHDNYARRVVALVEESAK